MKNLIKLLTVTAMLFAVGCQKYNDKPLKNRVGELENRVAALEELCKQMNTNISSLQTIVEALQNNDYVTSVTPVTKNGETIGYTIAFSKSVPITIYHGADGKDGVNGTDGKDGHTPVIGVRQDSEGVYYWTLDGEWLLDDAGNKIKAEGKDGADGKDGENGKDGQDGKDGANGTDGKDGITPQLKIENGYWYVSTDNGATWTNLGKATGENGKDGADGKDGVNGTDGIDGDSFFRSVDTSDSDYVIFTLADGTEIKLPTWYAFEQLKTLCNQMNTNINALQAIVEALQNNDYVKSVTPVMQNGTEIGYTITFSKSNPITIYHGQNGKDGANGTDGKDGVNGTNGKDGHTPIVGVRQDSDGIYYWTLDGEWLLDDAGNKIKAEGKDGQDGKDGANGTDGKDGITPQLKIENGYWYVSTDNGATWMNLGKATGENGKDGADGKDGENGKDGANGTDGKDGDSMFRSVTQDENNVYFTLADGTVITIAKFDTEKAKIIQFADPYVKKICVQNWDTDGDYELSYKEAAAITDIGTAFEASTRITTFDEFKYFIGLTEIPENAFRSSTILQIVLPPNIISIKKYAFSSCSRLYGKLVIPDSVETIEESAFVSCTDLNELVLGINIKTIRINAFTRRDSNGYYYPLNLSKVYCKSTSVPNMTSAFYNNNGNRLTCLYVPVGCKKIYMGNTICKNQFITIEEIEF